MKRILHSAHFLAAAAALCLLGCAHESVPEAARTWNVSAELSSVSTKISVDTGLKLHWSKGDNVRLLALGSDASSAEAQLTVYDVDAGLEKAMFKGQIVMGVMPSDCIFAFPYDGTSLSGTSTIYSYTSQDYSLTPCLWGKTAYSESGIECALSHIGGTIHLTNINSDIISVTLKGNSSEPIGQVTVDENGAVSVSGGSEITVTTAGEGYSSEAYINVPPVNFSKGFTVIAQTIGGATQYRSFSTSGTSDSGFDFSPSDGTGKMVEINWEGFTSFGITASASIAHTTDASGNLNGSTVTLNSFSIAGAPSKIITEYGVDLYKGTSSEGTLVRTLSLTSLPSSGTGLADAGTGWPYLPSSNITYTLLPWCRIHGGEKLYGTTTTLSSPAPTFSVSVSAYTSYDKYLDSDISSANACTAETIYDVSASANISTSILENSNYADLKNSITYTYTVDNGTLAESSEPGKYTVTGCAWGERTVTAQCTFDGASNSGERKCIITGLPYTISFKGNYSPSDWTLSNNGKNSSRLVLKRGEAYALTPSFYIPNTVKCFCSLSAYAYGGSVYSSYKPTVSIHASEMGSNSTTNATLSGTNKLPDYGASLSNITNNVSLQNNIKRICIYTSGTGSKISVGDGDMGVVCENFSVTYTTF
ncbi:MAG: hypothetical protein ACI4TM_00785 [Candidatus Cryptobacteroides sp.]